MWTTVFLTNDCDAAFRGDFHHVVHQVLCPFGKVLPLEDAHRAVPHNLLGPLDGFGVRLGALWSAVQTLQRRFPSMRRSSEANQLPVGKTSSHHPAGGDSCCHGCRAGGGVLVKLVSSDKVDGQSDPDLVLLSFGHQVLDDASALLVIQGRTNLETRAFREFVSLTIRRLRTEPREKKSSLL